MRLTPDNVTLLGQNLDHPEDLCLGLEGELYLGTEAGKVLQLSSDGTQREIADTGGFLLGLALDGDGALYACDCGKATVFRVELASGVVEEYSRGTAERPFALPNYPVFAANGDLFVSDSGEYWSETGTGAVFVVRANGTTELFHEGPFKFTNGLAIAPSNQWLYVAQSTASNVVRVPLHEPNGAVETVYELPPGTVPDGLAFADDGHLVIACYKPDTVYIGAPDGTVRVLVEDPTGELLLRPTNVALGPGKLYIANLGGWHLTVVDTHLQPAPLHYPHFNRETISS